MFEDQDEILDLSEDTPVFAPGELVSVEEFVLVTVDGWEGAADVLCKEGAEEAAEVIYDAIELLKNTYSVAEMIDLSQYDDKPPTEGKA